MRELTISFAAAIILAAPVAATSADKPDKPKLICKALPQTGTRLGGKRDCRTREQWDALAKQTQDDNQDLMNKPGAGPGG